MSSPLTEATAAPVGRLIFGKLKDGGSSKTHSQP